MTGTGRLNPVEPSKCHDKLSRRAMRVGQWYESVAQLEEAARPLKSGSVARSFNVEANGQSFIVIPCDTLQDETVDCPAGVAAWLLPDKSARIVTVNLNHSCQRNMQNPEAGASTQTVGWAVGQAGAASVAGPAGVHAPIESTKPHEPRRIKVHAPKPVPAAKPAHTEWASLERSPKFKVKKSKRISDASLNASRTEAVNGGSDGSSVGVNGHIVSSGHLPPLAPAPARPIEAVKPAKRPVGRPPKVQPAAVKQYITSSSALPQSSLPSSSNPARASVPTSALQPGSIYPDFDALNVAIHTWYEQRFPTFLLTVRRREEGGRPTWTCRGEKTPILCHFRISAKRDGDHMVITHANMTHNDTCRTKAGKGPGYLVPGSQPKNKGLQPKKVAVSSPAPAPADSANSEDSEDRSFSLQGSRRKRKRTAASLGGTPGGSPAQKRRLAVVMPSVAARFDTLADDSALSEAVEYPPPSKASLWKSVLGGALHHKDAVYVPHDQLRAEGVFLSLAAFYKEGTNALEHRGFRSESGTYMQSEVRILHMACVHGRRGLCAARVRGKLGPSNEVEVSLVHLEHTCQISSNDTEDHSPSKIGKIKLAIRKTPNIPCPAVVDQRYLYADLAADMADWYDSLYPGKTMIARSGETGGRRASWNCRNEGAPLSCKFKIAGKRHGDFVVVSSIYLQHSDACRASGKLGGVSKDQTKQKRPTVETLPAASVPVRATYRKGMILGVDTEGSASSDMDDSFGADPTFVEEVPEEHIPTVAASLPLPEPARTPSPAPSYSAEKASCPVSPGQICPNYDQMNAEIMQWHSEAYPKHAMYVRAGTSSTGYAVWSCKGEGGSTQCKFRISAKWLGGTGGPLKISHMEVVHNKACHVRANSKPGYIVTAEPRKLSPVKSHFPRNIHLPVPVPIQPLLPEAPAPVVEAAPAEQAAVAPQANGE